MAARSDVNDFRIPRMFCLLSNNACVNVSDGCITCEVSLGKDRMLARVPRRGGF